MKNIKQFDSKKKLIIAVLVGFTVGFSTFKIVKFYFF